MSQLSPLAQGKHKIASVAGLNNSTWTPVTCVLSECHSFAVFNQDGSAAMLVSTDGSGSAGEVSVPAGQFYSITLSAGRASGFSYGETLCYVKGAGSGATVSCAA